MGEKKRRQAAGHLPAASSGDPVIARLLLAAARAQNAGRLREAKDGFEEALRRDPACGEAWLGLGALALETGAVEAACNLLARAAECAPENAEARMQWARALQLAQRLDEACAQMEVVCRLRPGDAASWEGLGILRQAIGEAEAAAQAYRRALELRPLPALRAKLATLMPPIIASHEAIGQWRGRMEAALDALLADAAPGPASADPMQAALWTNFYLAYHGLCDRDLQMKTARLYRRLFPSLDYVAAHCSQPRRDGGRIRVGLISQFLHKHSIGRTSRGLFAQLSREEFEVSAIFIAPAVDDEYSRFIRQHAAHSLVVPQDLAAARALIESLRLDILFYQDIGMEPFGAFLAYSRLAPVQCVSFGHPDTTGIPAMDYFVSNDLFEPPGAEAHYSERLFRLHDLGSLAYYYRPELPERRKTRADFGFSDDAPLYLCPQNLFKFHPDMDALIAAILRRDPRGRLALVAGKIGHWTELLKRRWAELMPEAMDRIVFLPRMESGDFLNLVALADAMLDTVHFNGMNSSLEAFAVGTPVVTLPGEFQRGRHTQAMYRKMGLAEAIAGSADDYVELALRLGRDAAYRGEFRQRILERNACLFEDARVVREFERFFREAVAQAGQA